MGEIKMVVVNAATGAQLREATAEETTAFWAGQTHRHFKPGDFCFTHPVRLSGSLSVDYANGPGAWYGGAGF